MKIGIIGAGASGLLTAITSKNDSNEVIVFEKNESVGKKILVTGNGKCNYWNEDQSINKFVSKNSELIEQVIDKESAVEVLNLFTSLGIIPKIKNGYYYPTTNSASTIKNVLYDECIKRGVVFKTGINIDDVIEEDNKFILKTKNEAYEVDILVISTGSKAAPKTGSDGFGYEILERFGHNINLPLPGLCALKVKSPYKSWSGVRTDVLVSLYEDDEFIVKDEGELQLTDYGISGICVFNLSLYASLGLSYGKKEQVKINFVPFIKEDINEWFIKQSNLTKKSIHEIVKCILHEKIVNILLEKSKIRNVLYEELTNEEKEKLIKNLTCFNVDIEDTNTFDNAQVCIGGVSLEEINLKTMESSIVKNLFITGEVLDITGYCGGYNLGIAFRTGLKAGNYIRGLK